jgi:hypothetical protein
MSPVNPHTGGFLNDAGRIELGDVLIEAGNRYGTVLVVSLDGQPLRTSDLSHRAPRDDQRLERRIGHPSAAGCHLHVC